MKSEQNTVGHRGPPAWATEHQEASLRRRLLRDEEMLARNGEVINLEKLILQCISPPTLSCGKEMGSERLNNSHTSKG